MLKPIARPMIQLAFLTILVTLLVSITPAKPTPEELNRWETEAQSVSIVRDDWGIAHINGRTDADAVFGMIYAQAEDDFNRVENNYLLSLGRLAEAEGESQIYRDLRMKIFIDPDDLKAKYLASPSWLKALMNAWADGLNFYLAKHPDVKPRVITKFEPWMALSFTEGSIGGDIESINLDRLRDFYGGNPNVTAIADADKDDLLREPSGSNGFAIAPSNTADHHALLLINPHTSFFFRSELQMTSGEGMNAYGAVTWGQFFVYQGFNEHCGWMHTSSAVDQMDEYKETISKKGDVYLYRYGDKQLPVTTSTIKVPYKTPTGMAEKVFTVYRTQHGPIVRKTSEDGTWVSIRLMQEPVKALTQSYTRTKSKNYAEFRQVMELHTNSSNNTIFADSEGNIAYFHGNFIPRRDPKFDWTKPVDGSDPATDWHGLLSVDESPKLLNPTSGWLYNSNNWPWSAAGASSPKQSDYPNYVDDGVESARGLHAIRVLKDKKDFTLDSLISAAYDTYLTWFDKPLPALLKAWDATQQDDPLKAKTAEQITMMKTWDQRWSQSSVPTSLGVYWAENLARRVGGDARASGMSIEEYAGTKASREQLLQSFAVASDKLTADFGTWKTPWSDINRFQRITDDIVHPFTDAGPSIPVGFTSAIWGSLASFGARTYPGTKKMYGTSGNSFVAVIEFGPQIRAKAVTAGGESGDTKSPHFNDQAQRYATGNLREVYFYPSQLKGHTERAYHPGG
jgi:acyl-homoserine lactone acylase PvdQ